MKYILLAGLLTPIHTFAVPEQVVIPAGEFLMGCSEGDTLCDNDEGPQGGVKVFVPAFAIDVHETSVAEYSACVEAGECDRPFDYKRTHYCNYDAPGREN
jgi:formylglycine-generating enzyme required for sulfatase activity